MFRIWNLAPSHLLGSIQGPRGYAGTSNFGSSAKERRKTAKNCPCYIHIYEPPASPCSQLAPAHLGGQHMLCHHQQTSQGPHAPHTCLFTTPTNDGVVPMSPLGAAAPPEGVYEPTKKSAPAPAGSFEGRTFFVGSSSSSARACAMCLARPFWVPQPGPRSARATGSRANAGRNCQ